MSLLGGRLCEVAYTCTNPRLPPLLIVLLQLRGHGPLYALAMPVPVVQPEFVNLGSKRWSEATERGRAWEGVGFPPPTVGIGFFENLCMKTV